jgi:hypothetical protein
MLRKGDPDHARQRVYADDAGDRARGWVADQFCDLRSCTVLCFWKWSEQFGTTLTRRPWIPITSAWSNSLGYAHAGRRVGERNLVFKRGCDALGISSEPMPRNTPGARAPECFTGCRNRGKSSVDVTYVPRPFARGACLYKYSGQEVIGEGLRATVWLGEIGTGDGARVAPIRVNAKYVVMAAGCIHR